jgi:hypothetical protein
MHLYMKYIGVVCQCLHRRRPPQVDMPLTVPTAGTYYAVLWTYSAAAGPTEPTTGKYWATISDWSMAGLLTQGGQGGPSGPLGLLAIPSEFYSLPLEFACDPLQVTDPRPPWLSGSCHPRSMAEYFAPLMTFMGAPCNWGVDGMGTGSIYAAPEEAAGDASKFYEADGAQVGLGRIVALHDRSSALYYIR